MSKKCSAPVESKQCEKFSIATCDGCHQSFCLWHLNEHQQQLLGHMETLFNKHNLLREQFNKRRVYSENKIPDFSQELTLIDSWERDTLAQMTKIINAEAERARNVIQQITMENRQRMSANEVATSEELDRSKNRLEILSKELQARIKTRDFLEPDLQKWETQLKDIARYSLAPQAQKHRIIDKLSIGLTRKIEIDMFNVLGIAFEDGMGPNSTSNNIRQANDPLPTTNYNPDVDAFNRPTRFRSHASPIQNAQKSEYRGAGLLRSSSDRTMPPIREIEEERPSWTRFDYQADRRLEKDGRMDTQKNIYSPRPARKSAN